MCGIAGSSGGFWPGLAAGMNAAQAHRGPDGQGVWEDAEAGIALAHVRLAILDLSDAAAQPMRSPDGRGVVVFNGEIYNFRDLRRQMEAHGEIFRTTGDTEILLRGLQREGEAFLERLNGMFALAYWDRNSQELLLARDQLGVKPLYYCEPRPGVLVFASEIKALLVHPDVRRDVDPEAIVQHLTFGHASGERTALRGVRRLAPGSTLRWRREPRDLALRTFWRPRFDPYDTASRQEGARRLRAALSTAVDRQLVADVPVGAFLSGGLDSSFITALAGQRTGPRLECFTVAFPPEANMIDQVDPDAPHARRVAQALGLKLHEQEIQPDVVELLPRLIYHMDEPLVDPAILSCYLIARLASEQGVPVLLSGQGADELFAGYPRYPAMRGTSWLARSPLWMRRPIAGLGRMLPGAREGRLGVAARRLRRVFRDLDLPPDARFLSLCSAVPVSEVERALSGDFRSTLSGRSPHAACLEHMTRSGIGGTSRHLERDLSVYLPNHNLLYTDKMCMAVGLEARVPFLDLDLVSLATAMPVSWKVSGRQTKVILREAAEGVVPTEVIRRRKAGFSAPFRKWLRYDLAQFWGDMTSEAVVRRRGWFDPKALQDARGRSQRGADDLYMLQWAVLTCELWARRFLDSGPATAPAA